MVIPIRIRIWCAYGNLHICHSRCWVAVCCCTLVVWLGPWCLCVLVDVLGHSLSHCVKSDHLCWELHKIDEVHSTLSTLWCCCRRYKDFWDPRPNFINGLGFHVFACRWLVLWHYWWQSCSLKGHTTHLPTKNPTVEHPGQKHDDFGGSIGTDVVNFIEPNFIQFIFTPIRVGLITQKQFWGHLKKWHFSGRTP